MECIICLDEINTNINDNCKFNCCNNNVHNSCLIEWVVNNIDKKDISKCFICSQKNNAIETIISHYAHISSEIINNNNNNTNTNTNNNNTDRNNYIIVDISTNVSEQQNNIQIKSFFILKLIYSTLLISLLLLGFIYISPI
jgi:hypothetical protein